MIKNKSHEKFPYNPSSPYSASKASADHLIKSYVRTYNCQLLYLTVVIIMDLINFLKNLFQK